MASSNCRKVLVVDDDPGLRELITSLLATEDVTVSEAIDGKDAVLKVIAERPDLALLDVRMPQLNGLTGCKAIRAGAESRNTPVIMVTALTATGRVEECMEAGADDFPGKPFPMKELLIRVRAMFRTAQVSDRVPSDQHWRLFREFADSTAFLDIETTGLSGHSDHITTAVMYDGCRVRHYVHGDNLRDFGHQIRDYKLLVTYNGKTFDLPFIRHPLGLPMDQAHIDLRYVLASLGYRGGLKKCERQLGLDRGGLADVDGYFAVLLWREYERTRNPRVLETLLAYNTLDVLNLVHLMTVAYNLKLRGTPFEGTHKLPSPSVPDNPFVADADAIERIRRRCW